MKDHRQRERNLRWWSYFMTVHDFKYHYKLYENSTSDGE